MMPSGCLARCISWSVGGVEDGVLEGKQVEIDDQYKKPVSLIFQSLLKAGHINVKKTAVEFGANILTYEELELFSTSLANDIRDRIGYTYQINNKDGDPVIATICHNSEMAVVLLMAILKTGAAFLPIDPEYPESLIVKILEKFQPVLVIASNNTQVYNKYDPHKIRHVCPLITLEEMWADMEFTLTRVTRASIRPEILTMFPQRDPAYLQPMAVIHTRGFLDNPEGVRISHLSLMNQCNFLWKELPAYAHSDHSTSLTYHISHVGALAQIFVPLLRGCTVIIFKNKDLIDGHQFLRDVALKQVNRLALPHYYLHTFLMAIEQAGRKQIIESLHCVKHVFCIGGILRQVEDILLFFEIFKGAVLYCAWGSPQTSGNIIYEVFHNEKEVLHKTFLGKIMLGKVMYNTKIYIMNDEYSLIEDSKQGQAIVSGNCLALGNACADYWETESVSFTNPYPDEIGVYARCFRSGEFGRILLCPDGKRRLRMEGREDRIIKHKGHDFYGEDVKPFLASLPFAKEAFVYVLNKYKTNQEVIGFILVKPGYSPLQIPKPVTIEHMIRTKLPEWAAPSEVALIKNVPRHYFTDHCTGCLVQEFRYQREPRYDVWQKDLLVPTDKLGAAIDLVKAIYRMTSLAPETLVVNLKKSFYELGGTSNNVIHVLISINKNGYGLTVKDFYAQPSLMDIITIMASKKPHVMGTGEPEDERSATTRLPSTPSQISLFMKTSFSQIPELFEKYAVEPLTPAHKKVVTRMIAIAFSEKSELSNYNMVETKSFKDYLSEMWNLYLSDGDSCIVKRLSDGKVVAAALCHDVFQVIDATKAYGTLYNLMEFYHDVKGNVLLYLPHRIRETLEIDWVATQANLSPAENVELIIFIHQEILKMARMKYSGVFVVSANPLCKALLTEAFRFDIFDDFQINKYRTQSGIRLFRLADDTVVSSAMYFQIRDPQPPSPFKSEAVVDPLKYFEQATKRELPSTQSYHGKDIF